MKTSIHPQWYSDAKVVCSCGNTFTVGATKKDIHVDICSVCHPFYTGEMKFVDTLGRVEKFQQKQKIAAAKAGELAERKKKKEERVASLKNQKSLKDMLMGLK